MKKWISILLLIVVVSIAIFSIYSLFGLNLTGSAVANVGGGGSVKIPLSKVSENAKWYEYDSSGTSIRFFVVKANDGTIKTGFDACDVCYNTRKGYRQDGDFMVCNNCGNRYPITGLGTENKRPGGCWPGYLPSEIVDGNVVIRKADLEKGRRMFV